MATHRRNRHHGRWPISPIGRSLSQVLRDVRRATWLATLGQPQTRTLWADGVCINQQDLIEKNSQIPLMDQIYRKASRVITYIGEADNTTAPALTLAHDILALARVTSDTADITDADGLHAQQCAVLGIDYHGFHEGPHPDKRVRTLQAMLDAPWSRRLWIVQESLLNDNGMIMMCGEHEMEWTLLYHVGSAVMRLVVPRVLRTNAIGNPDPHAGSAAAIRTLARLRNQFRSLPVLNLMLATRDMPCSDPRDKVYGLYGVFRVMEAGSALEVDYQKTVGEVYTDAAHFLLAQPTGLGLFAAVIFRAEGGGVAVLGARLVRRQAALPAQLRAGVQGVWTRRPVLGDGYGSGREDYTLWY